MVFGLQVAVHPDRSHPAYRLGDGCGSPLPAGGEEVSDGKVLVLGAGPAGLFAAHAASITNNDVLIYSKKRKSYMRGAQYLHAPIPMLSGQPFQVSYELEGEADGYREKIYKDPRTKVSVDSLVGRHMAWDMREAYDRAWEIYSPYVSDLDLGLEQITELVEQLKPDMLISSLPAGMLCEESSHMFVSEQVWVTENYRGTKPNTVLCSGELDVPWYRTSRIHGWDNTEYPENKKPPLSADKVHAVTKPVKTTCDCLEQSTEGKTEVLRVGRYGTFTKGVLSHSAFYDTFNRLDGKSRKESNQ